jgi:hypothetical protein
MAAVVLAIIAVLAHKSKANPTRPGRECMQLTVPVAVNTTNSIYDVPRVDSNIDAVDFIWDTTTWSHQSRNRAVGEYQVHETFNIHAQLCVPSQGAKKDILQIATHGVAFDGR